jgi:hypothetical protein
MSQIWKLTAKKSKLDLLGFVIACHLANLAAQGRAIPSVVPEAVREKLASQLVQPSTAAAVPILSVTSHLSATNDRAVTAPSTPPSLAGQLKSYAQKFEEHQVNGFVVAQVAPSAFASFSLPREKMSQIWRACAQSGKMGLLDFILACHLSKQAASGYSIPSVVPATVRDKLSAQLLAMGLLRRKI